MQFDAKHKSSFTQRQAIVIENIEILELIGSGGMSEVYKARQVDLDRIVALKVLLAQSFDDDESLRRFQNEARITSTLKHKNVVQILTFGVSKDHHAYIVMEYIEGKSLANLLKTEGRLRLSRFRKIFLDILSALVNAHELGLVHRDIKPGNIMICKNDEGEEFVKLVDFGIAKLVAEANERSQKLTKTGALVGSPLYMSPEQCLGKPLDARSDLYSLSCVMFEALSGEPPFSGDSVLDLMHKHATQAPPTVQFLRGKVEIVQELAELVIRGLAKDPASRPQTAGDLSEGLKLAFEGVTLDKVPKMQAAKASESGRLKLVLSLVMVLSVFVCVFFFSNISKRGTEAKLKEISPDSKLKEGLKLVRDAENLARIGPLDKVESMYEKAIVLLQGQKDPQAKKDLGKALMSAAQDLEILNGLQGQKNRNTNPALRAKIDSYYNEAISIARERRDLSEYYAALAAKFGSMSCDKSTIKERFSMLKDAESVLKDSQYIDLFEVRSLPSNY